MISDLPVIVVAQDVIADTRVEYKHLVKLVAQQVRWFVVCYSLFKVEHSKLLLHVRQVVVEVTSHDDSRMSVLSSNVINDLYYSLCSLMLVGLFASFEIAWDQVDPTSAVSELYLRPVHLRPKSLYKSHLIHCLLSHKRYASTFVASHGLLYIVAIKVDVACELGLCEEPYVLSHVSHQSLQVTLLLVPFDAPHIHTAHFQWHAVAHRVYYLLFMCLLIFDSVLVLVIHHLLGWFVWCLLL